MTLTRFRINHTYFSPLLSFFTILRQNFAAVNRRQIAILRRNHIRSEGSVRTYRISRYCEILYFIRSAAYCQTCEQNSRALHAQTMLSGLALCSLMNLRTRHWRVLDMQCKKIPTHLLILYGLTEPSAVLVILR